MDLAKTKQHRSTLIRLGTFMLLMLLAVGCIRPVDADSVTPTASSPIVNNVDVNVPSAATPVVGATPATQEVAVPTFDPNSVSTAGTVSLSAADLEAIQNYVINDSLQALQPDTLEVWWQQSVFAPEEIVAFSFRNPSGLNCIGVAMGARDASNTLVVSTGNASCSTDISATSLASSWLLLSAQGFPIIATVSVLLDDTAVLGGASVVFSDASQNVVQNNIVNNRFLHIRVQFFELASQVIFFGIDGAEIRRQLIIP